MEKCTNRKKQAAMTKQRIYGAALELFAHRPYEEVTIRDICAKAGVSIGIFYHYYRAKGNMLSESLGYDQFDGFIKGQWAAYERTTPLDNIRFLVRLQLETVVKMGYPLMAVFYKHQLDNEKKYELEEKRFFFNRILSEAEREVANGGLFGDPVTIAEDIIHNSRGVIYNWCINAGEYDLFGMGEKFLQMVLNYYCKNPQERHNPVVLSNKPTQR